MASGRCHFFAGDESRRVDFATALTSVAYITWYLTESAHISAARSRRQLDLQHIFRVQGAEMSPGTLVHLIYPPEHVDIRWQCKRFIIRTSHRHGSTYSDRTSSVLSSSPSFTGPVTASDRRGRQKISRHLPKSLML